MSRGERGVGTVVTLAICLSLASVAWAAVVVVSWFSQARSAADAADLVALGAAAARSEGGDACSAARQTARRNDVTLVSCAVVGDGRAFVVEVSVAAPLEPRLPSGPREVRRTAAAGTG